jgi:hypothetical protein
MTSYLVLESLALAQARSAQQAEALGCEPGTTYWWAQIEHPTTQRGALGIEADGAFGPAAEEIAALVPAASMDPSWFAVGA